uniref:Uncharacterized protein n=1 Tax=Arundo donax TaxID=35708 RepID=A0A0A9BT52_ARUDO
MHVVCCLPRIDALSSMIRGLIYAISKMHCPHICRSRSKDFGPGKVLMGMGKFW